MLYLFERIKKIIEARLSSQPYDQTSSQNSQRYQWESDSDGNSESPHSNPYAEYPKQVVEDLLVFGLTPPSSLEEVKKIRNKTFLKYHSDRFINDPEKYETSKQLMQIYNDAYARLKLYYSNRA